MMFLGLFIMAMLWLLPRIWRGIRGVFTRLGRLTGNPGTGTGKNHTP